mmetsp:Transcript_20759/g.64835  ORF Transcript_20759/g.64835 Transcript_20759/m.64835 type:complete len:206 (+) Transcript_20759:298-915(+)
MLPKSGGRDLDVTASRSILSPSSDLQECSAVAAAQRRPANYTICSCGTPDSPQASGLVDSRAFDSLEHLSRLRLANRICVLRREYRRQGHGSLASVLRNPRLHRRVRARGEGDPAGLAVLERPGAHAHLGVGSDLLGRVQALHDLADLELAHDRRVRLEALADGGLLIDHVVRLAQLHVDCPLVALECHPPLLVVLCALELEALD